MKVSMMKKRDNYDELIDKLLALSNQELSELSIKMVKFTPKLADRLSTQVSFAFQEVTQDE